MKNIIIIDNSISERFESLRVKYDAKENVFNKYKAFNYSKKIKDFLINNKILNEITSEKTVSISYSHENNEKRSSDYCSTIDIKNPDKSVICKLVIHNIDFLLLKEQELTTRSCYFILCNFPLDIFRRCVYNFNTKDKNTPIIEIFNHKYNAQYKKQIYDIYNLIVHANSFFFKEYNFVSTTYSPKQIKNLNDLKSYPLFILRNSIGHVNIIDSEFYTPMELFWLLSKIEFEQYFSLFSMSDFKQKIAKIRPIQKLLKKLNINSQIKFKVYKDNLKQDIESHIYLQVFTDKNYDTEYFILLDNCNYRNLLEEWLYMFDTHQTDMFNRKTYPINKTAYTLRQLINNEDEIQLLEKLKDY